MFLSLSALLCLGLCWAWLGVIRILIRLHLALHRLDVSNAIQNDQNEINHESDGSSWLFKLRRNDFCKGSLIQHILLCVYVSFIQYEVQGAMLKMYLNWYSALPSPCWGAFPSAPPGLWIVSDTAPSFLPQSSLMSAFVSHGYPDHFW